MPADRAGALAQACRQRRSRWPGRRARAPRGSFIRSGWARPRRLRASILRRGLSMQVSLLAEEPLQRVLWKYFCRWRSSSFRGMRPHVVAQLAVSIDGATTGFEADQARFYAMATLWQEDVTLVGADTILAQDSAVRTAPKPGPRPDGPLLAVVDSRHRVRNLDALARARLLVRRPRAVLRSDAGSRPRQPTRELVTGYDRIDLAEALELLGRRGAQVVRVDSRRHLDRSTARPGPGRRACAARSSSVVGAGPPGTTLSRRPAGALLGQRRGLPPRHRSGSATALRGRSCRCALL